MNNRILIIGTTARSFFNFRIEFLIDLQKRGFDVHICALNFSEKEKEYLKSLDIICHEFTGERFFSNPIKEIKSLSSIYRLIKRLEPDIVFSFFIKPCIYGTLSAKLAGVQNIFCMLEGLGALYADESAPFRDQLVAICTQKLMLFVSIFCKKVVVLNEEDRTYLSEKGIVSSGKVINLKGIGVDLKKYVFSLKQNPKPSFIFVGRLLKEKGIYDFLECAEIIKQEYPEVHFTVLGDFEPKEGEIKIEDLKPYIDRNIITYHGFVKNIEKYYKDSDVIILPSIYREGVPRTLQEAAAMGLAIITYENVGSKEVVIDNYNGLIVQRNSLSDLVDKIKLLINNPKKITEMSSNSRKLAEKDFNIKIKNSTLISILSGRL